MLRVLWEAWDSTDVSCLGFSADNSHNPHSAGPLMIPSTHPFRREREKSGPPARPSFSVISEISACKHQITKVPAEREGFEPIV